MKNYLKRGESGFTLLEVVIYAVLLGFFSTIITLNFGGARTNALLERIAYGIISDLRRAQNLTVAGVTIPQPSPSPSIIACGYGLRYLDSETYAIYAGNEANCSTANRNYQGGQDLTVQTIKIPDNIVELKSSFNEIFFEPPDPKTYLNNSSSLSGLPITITLGFKSKNCPANCKTITIFPSGKIDLN